MTTQVPRVRIDPFLIAIIAAAVVATVLPVSGAAIRPFSMLTTVAIGVLFALYGARLSPTQALAGLKHWRLQGLIVLITFVLFPVLGVALHALSTPIIGSGLALGLLWLTLVPSTVQSSVNFTSLAHGNVPAALVSASLSNLLGVIVTPVLAILLMGATGGQAVGATAVVAIVAQILLPFTLGQVSRRWSAQWVATNRAPLRIFDQAVIVLVVYTAFSAGVRSGMWQAVTGRQLILVMALEILLLGFMLWFTWWLAKRLGFNRADRIAIQFCGTKKSLASGLPMATVLFAHSLTPVSTLVLPLMIFHQGQLMACAALAARYARSTGLTAGAAGTAPVAEGPTAGEVGRQPPGANPAD